MKSFRLYHRDPPKAVRSAADYSPQEAQEIKRSFAAECKHRTRHLWLAFTSLAIAASCLACASMFRSDAWAVGLICLPIFLVLGPTIPNLYCPGCTKNIDLRSGPYCPECGSRDTVRPDQHRKMRCGHCGRPITFGSGRGRPRRYEVRFCRNCGLLLDESGV